MVELRPAHTVSQHPDPAIPSRSRGIRFRHPGYKDQNILFTLLGHDSPEGGLHHETARLACAIVAGNRWDGYLSISPTGPRIAATELLLGSDYYFIVPSPSQGTFPSYDSSAPSTHPPVSSLPSTYTYPIVPCFREWRFPHASLPTLWNKLSTEDTNPVRSTSDAVIIRDGSCRMTEHVEECDIAHLCPKSEGDWFRFNEMDQHVFQKRRTGDAAMNDPSNLLLLRADLHRSFDKLQFVFIPKADGVLSTHVLGESRELWTLYHNTILHKVGVAPEFLFARFAWAVFPLLAGFLQRRRPRLLMLATEEEPRWVDSNECVELGKSSNGRSRGAGQKKDASSSKRTRSEAETEDMDGLQEDVTGGSKRRKTETRSPRREVIHDSRSDDGLTAYPTRRSTSAPLLEATSSTVTSTTNQPVDFTTVLDQRLQFERARSDPKGRWLKERQWLDDIIDNGGAIDAADIPRYLSVTGKDVIPGIGFEV